MGSDLFDAEESATPSLRGKLEGCTACPAALLCANSADHGEALREYTKQEQAIKITASERMLAIDDAHLVRAKVETFLEGFACVDRVHAEENVHTYTSRGASKNPDLNMMNWRVVATFVDGVQIVVPITGNMVTGYEKR